jgi:signal transduction histidine kinase/CheY-like chemotaxis protein
MVDAAYICSSDYHIEYMNPKMIRKAGKNITGEICYKSLYNRDDTCPWCAFEKIQTGDHITQELIDPLDKHIYDMTNSPVYHGDGAVSMLTILRDITKSRTIEKQLHQARKMESIGTLAGGIAHDFNNLLFIISGNAELALGKTTETSPVYKNLNEIKSACLKSAGIIRQLLNYSRKTDQELKPVNAVSVIEDALIFLRSVIPSTIEIKKKLSKKDIIVLADPIQINQILMNIFTNAAQAMEETGGAINITVKQRIINENTIDHPELSTGEYLKITISDTGPGISPESIDKIFDPYYTTRGVGKGSGMGLAIVHRLVKNHNGSISVKSKPDQRTSFTIFIPVIATKPKSEIIPVEKIPGGYGKILFVDDEKSIATMSREILTFLGYDVEIKNNPEEAFELFKSNPDYFDLVITDMTMPQMNGVQLFKKIKDIRPEIPIIICTGHSTLMNEEKAEDIGAAGYLLKPVSMSTFATMIKTILS